VTRLRAATRGSELARWQTDHVASLLRAVDPAVEVEAVVVQTTGDRDLERPVYEMGGKGVFVKEVQAAVLDGRADFAVHSAKDLPSVELEGLVLAAVPPRGDVRDALAGARLDDLRPGACVATGSVRRRVLLADRRPDLTFTSLRGNIATRLARLDGADVDAVVVAVAAVERLGLTDHVAEVLDPEQFVPQVGQGALAVECRTDDAVTRDLLARIEDVAARRTVDAERGFLAELGGDCDLPAGALARIEGPAGEPASGDLVLDAVIASLDGHTVLRHRRTAPPGDPPAALGRAAARHLLDDCGGTALLITP
jgi:hydroxymethylbilane synthase